VGKTGPPVTISVPHSHRPALAAVSGLETHRPPVVSGPETYTHPSPAFCARGMLLIFAMKPLSGWRSGGLRTGSYSNLLEMISVSGPYAVSGDGGVSVSVGTGGESRGGGGGKRAHPHSRSLGNLVSPLQPLEYSQGLASHT
jgi:hypothetical protein